MFQREAGGFAFFIAGVGFKLRVNRYTGIALNVGKVGVNSLPAVSVWATRNHSACGYVNFVGRLYVGYVGYLHINPLFTVGAMLYNMQKMGVTT